MTKLEWSKKAHYGLFKTSAGWWAAAWTSKGLSGLVLPQISRTAALRKLAEYLPPMPEAFWDKPLSAIPPSIPTAVRKALVGKPFTRPVLDLSFLTPFQQRILFATAEIPLGQVRTYGWTARRAGSPRGFQAAGQALHRNPIYLLIPCHRVIAGGNRLGGYGGGVEWKTKLLKIEKIPIRRSPDGSYMVSKALLK
jgi:methylated-DNA-[protein]-cysteine S-methyltransferase